METGCYIAIDLKSFYASVECVERGLDPLTTNLLVADETRTDKTICLAATPSLKRFGVPGRARLFEAKQLVNQANALRAMKAPGGRLRGSSWDARKLAEDPCLAVDFITAPPRMALYMEHSTRIYQIYLRYAAPEDIHVYSIDEVFLDAAPYLKARGMTPYEFTRAILRDVVQESGITATAGIGTNLYLCKVAMDIVAKHTEPDGDGVRIAMLDELSYRETLWEHRPLTDFWRVGRGYQRKLERHGMYTMGDIALRSLQDGESLYRLFGINAELLIDHAWGWESCTMADIKAYRPQTRSLSSGQVLTRPYPADQARLVTREMADLLVLDLVDKGLVTDQLTLTVGYDVENLKDPVLRQSYSGRIVTDHYGREIPKHAHGTARLEGRSASTRQILRAVTELYDKIVDSRLLVRRITLAACNLSRQEEQAETMEQLDFFTDQQEQQRRAAEELRLRREQSRQKAVLDIRKKYGKNAIVRGMNLQEGATAMERSRQIGGHRA